MAHPAEEMDILRWIEKYIDRKIESRINELGIPRLFIPGIVKQTVKVGNNTFADVFLNGDSTATTNIPVNPDIASNVTANTPVWVFAINFDHMDKFVAMRKLA